MVYLSRRAFLIAGGFAGAVARGTATLGKRSLGRLILRDPGGSALAAGPEAQAPGLVAPHSPSWVDKPMRWAQLTLVEDDPGKFDLRFWLDYFRRTRSDAVCLSAGGCVAYYPTRITLHHRSRWLGDTDPFGELVAGCRKLGMVVIARTDPHATYDDVHDAHPDWIA